MPELLGFTVAAHGDREIHGTREFAAPSTLVWEAFTNPQWIKRWLLGPDGWVMTVCEVDLRVGGPRRLLSRRPGKGKRRESGTTKKPGDEARRRGCFRAGARLAARSLSA